MTSDTSTSESVAPDPRVARSREKLLDAATQLLVEAGARGVTVDAVAERSGVAKSTLYRHWGSRTDLLIDVLRSNVPEIEVPDPALGFEGALRALVAQVAATLADPRRACILPAIFALRQQIPDVDELSARDQDEKMEAIRVVLALGVDEGAITADLDPMLVGYQLLGPLVLAALTGNEVDTAALADQVVDRFIGSVRP